MNGSDDDLRAFLRANGIQDVDIMTRTDMEVFAEAMLGGQETTEFYTSSADLDGGAAATSERLLNGGNSGLHQYFDAEAQAGYGGTQDSKVTQSPDHAAQDAAFLALADDDSAVNDDGSIDCANDYVRREERVDAEDISHIAAVLDAVADSSGSCSTTDVVSGLHADPVPASSSETDTIASRGADADAAQSAADDGYAQVVAAFVDVTGCDPGSARGFLEAFGWDLETAVSMFLENPATASGGDGAGGGSSGGGDGVASTSLFSSPSTQDAQHNNANIYDTPPIASSIVERFEAGLLDSGTADLITSRVSSRPNSGIVTGAGRDEIPPIPGLSGIAGAAMPRLPGAVMAGGGGGGDDMDAMMTALQGMMAGVSIMPMAAAGGARSSAAQRAAAASRAFGPYGGDDDYDYEGGDGNRAERYDEHGVRLPDPVRKARLLGGPAGGRMRFGSRTEDGIGALDGPDVDWMFPPPTALSYVGSLDQARALALSESRWVLTNIQSHTEFASHMLNRDTWVDETLQSILAASFLFWQRGHTSPDGQQYMQTYRLTSTDDLPHVGIIDPRTGAKLQQLTGFITPEDLTLKLMEFADRNSLTASASTSKGNSKPGSNCNSTPGSRPSTSYDDIAALGAAQEEGGGTSSSAASTGVMAGVERIQQQQRDRSGSNLSDVGLPLDRASFGSSGGGGGGSKVGGLGIADGGITGSVAARTLDHSSKERSGSEASSSLELSEAATESTAAPAAALNSRPLPDYGPVPDDPTTATGAEAGTGTTGTIIVKVSIKLPSGKSYARAYPPNTPVRALFAVVVQQEAAELSSSSPSPSSRTPTAPAEFDLVTRFPVQSLRTKLDSTLEECNLVGSQVMFRWVDNP